MELSLGAAYVFLIGALVSKGTWAAFSKLAKSYTQDGAALPFPQFMFAKAIGVQFAVWSCFLIAHAIDNSIAIELGNDNYTIAFGVGSGVVNMIGNGLMVVAVEECGLSVAFPVGIGIALVAGTGLTYTIQAAGDVLFLTAGVTCILIAVALTGYTMPKRQDKNVASIKLMYPIVAGLFSSLWAPLGAVAGTVETTTPLTTTVLITIGYLLAATVMLLVFTVYKWLAKGDKETTNATIKQDCCTLEAAPQVEEGKYNGAITDENRKATFPCSHTCFIVFGLCWLSGVVWGLGTAMYYMAADRAGFAVSYGISQCSPLIAAWVGLIAFAEAPRNKCAFIASQVFYISGISLLAAAASVHS